MLKIWPGEVGGEGGGTKSGWVHVCSTKTIYFKIIFEKWEMESQWVVNFLVNQIMINKNVNKFCLFYLTKLV